MAFVVAEVSGELSAEKGFECNRVHPIPL